MSMEARKMARRARGYRTGTAEWMRYYLLLTRSIFPFSPSLPLSLSLSLSSRPFSSHENVEQANVSDTKVKKLLSIFPEAC